MALERYIPEDIYRPQSADDPFMVAPPVAAPPVASAPSNFSVFGDTGIAYGLGGDGQYRFGSDVISPQDFAVLAARGDPGVASPPPVSGIGDSLAVTPPSALQDAKAAALDVSRPKPQTFDPVAVPAATPNTAPSATPVTSPTTGATALLPTDPNFMVNTVGVPDFGMYGRSSSSYQAPQLMPADPSRGLGTPYYATYTNDGDFAGAVMVAPGQPIRLVDNKTGQVVFEGKGPEAAQQAAGIANAVSDDRGRKASWSIQAEQAGGGWQTQAYERYDPKSNVLGTLLDIAAPFILAALFPPLAGIAGALGATGTVATIGNAAILGALANTGSGLIQGESFGQAVKGGLTAGALSGLGAGVLSKLPTSITSPITDVLGKVNNTLYDTIGAGGPLNVVLDPINKGLVNILDAAGNVVGTVAGGIDEVRNAVDGARGLIQNAVGLGNGPTVTGLTPGDIGNVNFSVTPGDIGLGLDPFTVAPVNVVGGGAPVIPGVPFTPGSVGPDGVTTVDTVDVSPQDKPPPPVVYRGVDPNDLDGVTTDLDPLTVTAPQPPPPGVPTIPTTVAPVDVSPQPETPTTPVITPVDPPVTSGPPVTVVEPPIIPGVPTPPQTTGSGKYSINSTAGTRASLSPIFSAALPAPTFGTRTPRNPQVDQRYAIERPEQSFFVEVPDRGLPNFAVPSPQQALLAGIPDLDGDGVVTDQDRVLWRRRFGGQGYAKGGRSDGRSDDIEARLSDGEYVIDAETVALLGNGSSKAGADALDRFRVNVRKHKGRDLAKGRFSVDAREPHDYLEAR